MIPVKGHAYSLRVDYNLSHPLWCDEDSSWMEFSLKYIPSLGLEMSDHLCVYELSENGKPHYQCILWFSSQLSTNNMSQIRNWWRLDTRSARTYQPVSFKKSTSPDSLASYCLKNQGVICSEDQCSLSVEQLAAIPAWSNTLGEKKLKKKELFNKKCADYLKLVPYAPHYYSENGYQCSLRQAHSRAIMCYLTEFSRFYFEIYSSPMRRMQGISILIKLQILDHQSYVESLYGNFFP